MFRMMVQIELDRTKKTPMLLPMSNRAMISDLLTNNLVIVQHIQSFHIYYPANQQLRLRVKHHKWLDECHRLHDTFYLRSFYNRPDRRESSNKQTSGYQKSNRNPFRVVLFGQAWVSWFYCRLISCFLRALICYPTILVRLHFSLEKFTLHHRCFFLFSKDKFTVRVVSKGKRYKRKLPFLFQDKPR